MAIEKENLVNDVDVSPEKIEAEWRQIAEDEGLIYSENPEIEVSEISEDTATDIPEDTRAGAAASVSWLLNFCFVYGFTYLKPAWQITQQECSDLAIVWGKVIAKYAPLQILNMLPAAGSDGECIECDAVLVTLGVIKAREQVPGQSSDSENPEQQPEQSQAADFEPMKTVSEIKTGE